ncbi:MAG: restriction endonuclease subunit R [Leptolyngbyaceae cyanobacterium]
MTQLLQARDISLDELHTQFGLQSTSEKTFFPEWQSESLAFSDFERQQLERVRANYSNLASRKAFSEEAVKMVILSPLLDLAGFYQSPFAIKTEDSVEISAEDNDLLVKGKIDVLVVHQQFWVLVIESKSTQFDVLTALPQALTYMLSNPNSSFPVYGLLANGREFVFVKLTNQSELSPSPVYARSYALSIERNGDLEQVLNTLKVIQRSILQPN